MKTNNLWNKDDGKSYRLYEKKCLKRLKKLGWGGRVITTQYAIDNGIFKEATEGILVGFGRDVYVIREGNKTANTYWCGFWKPKYQELLKGEVDEK